MPRFAPTPSLGRPTVTYVPNAVGAVSIIPSGNSWTNSNQEYVDAYVANAGSYTGTTTITPFGSRAVTVPNASVGMLYRIPVGATLTWGVGASVVSVPIFDGFAE